jgi:hypothetical protein
MMLPFVLDGRECLTQGDKGGAVLNVGALESERTARRRLIVGNFRRHERHRRDDLLLWMRRGMNSASAVGESRLRLAAGGGVRRRDGDTDENAAIERCDLDLAERAIRRGKRRRLQSNKDERARGAGNCGDRSLVRKAITFEGQAVSAVTEAAESHRPWSLPKRFAFDGNTTRRKRLVSVWDSEQCRRVHAGSQMFVHRREARRRRNSGDLRMLRTGDKGYKTTVPDAVLPNYWANCLLIEQRLLALCIAEGRLRGAQWQPECPC